MTQMRNDECGMRNEVKGSPRRLPSIQYSAFNIQHSRRGSAAVSFILAFPIFLTIVGVVVQMALMVNAKIMVTHAADAAARAAATSLPDGHPENIQRAAWTALAPVSPKSPNAAASEATDTADALKRVGANPSVTFAARYAYAMGATDVTWTPQKDFAGTPGEVVEVTVTYKFMLTVPGAMRMVPDADPTTVAGVKGRFWSVTAKGRAVTAHGRKAPANGDGWPD